jgi:hypothetical protein
MFRDEGHRDHEEARHGQVRDSERERGVSLIVIVYAPSGNLQGWGLRGSERSGVSGRKPAQLWARGGRNAPCSSGRWSWQLQMSRPLLPPLDRLHLPRPFKCPLSLDLVDAPSVIRSKRSVRVVDVQQETTALDSLPFC